jgi:hypothetical protein
LHAGWNLADLAEELHEFKLQFDGQSHNEHLVVQLRPPKSHGTPSALWILRPEFDDGLLPGLRLR